MESLIIPNSDLEFSRLGFGCEQMGLYQWGDVNINDLSDAVSVALDIGVNFFDTSDVYGLGKSEQNLSKFLGNRRQKVSIITKVGVRFNNGIRYFDNSPEWINEAVNASLKRLNTDYIDLYQLHYWDSNTPFEIIYECFEKLKEGGKIRAYGFSNILLNDIKSESVFFQNTSTFSYEYSLANRENENLIKQMINPMVFLAYGVLGQGILSGKYNSDTVFPKDDRRSFERYKNFSGDNFIKNLKIVEELTKLGIKYNVNPSQVALRFLLDFLPNSIIISGIKNVSQLVNNFNIEKFSLDNSEIEHLLNLS